MNPSGSGPAYIAPGSLTLQLGVTRQNESQRRERQVSATRPASSTTWSTPACLRCQLAARPACPAALMAKSTLRSIPAEILIGTKLRPGEAQRRAGGAHRRVLGRVYAMLT